MFKKKHLNVSLKKKAKNVILLYDKLLSVSLANAKKSFLKIILKRYHKIYKFTSANFAKKNKKYYEHELYLGILRSIPKIGS